MSNSGRGIDPHGGPPYREPTWQEARDLIAGDIEHKSGIQTRPLNGGSDSALGQRIIALRDDDDAILVEVGQAPEGHRVGVVVDVAARALKTGGSIHDVLSTDWWDPCDGGSPEDDGVVGWLLATLPADLSGWGDWLADALARPLDPSTCPVPLPPPSNHRPARRFG